jgi:mannose-6-phosphate isomerase-like protein (cupin superfamily)
MVLKYHIRYPTKEDIMNAATTHADAASIADAAVTNPAPIIRGADDGERRWFFGGGIHVWKARAEETAGAFLLFEDVMEEGKATPLHTHPDSDESMYILEGEILMHMGDRDYHISAGGLAVAPRGVPHAFLVLSPVVRMLCLHTPGVCEAFYWDASDPVAAGASPSGIVDFDRVQESAVRNGGIELIGPPPFAQPPSAQG